MAWRFRPHALDKDRARVDWQGTFEDKTRIPGAWISVLEALLFIAAAVVAIIALLDFLKTGRPLSAATTVVIWLMSFWPQLRRWLRGLDPR